MNLTTSRLNGLGAKLATLLGTASLLTLADAIAARGQEVAQAQMAQALPEEAPENVLITGSLIHGATAVGVPVTNLSPQDYAMTGALTTSDLFRTIPTATVSPGPVATQSGANIARNTRVNIRGLDTNAAVRTLLMVDGIRFPPQADGGCTVDPSIIPGIALDRIDVLVDGASATYGSDAIAGVINIILKRGYDGAITELRAGVAKGKNMYQASQLWGRTWDGGDITLSYEWLDDSPILGNEHSNFTLNFSPWGLDNRTPIRSSIPGTVSAGAVNAPNALGTNCTNCWAIPHGTGVNFVAGTTGLGPLNPFSASTLNWSVFGTAANGGPTNPQAGTRNAFNPYTIAWYDAAQQRNAGTLTVDQKLTKDITFEGEAFYSNRRAEYLNPSNLSPSSNNDLQIAVPTFNPYYPTGGAPTNLRVSYNMGIESPSFTDAYEVSARYMGAINIALPYGWNGRLYYSETFDKSLSHVGGEVNQNAVSAALGWTIAATAPVGTTPGVATWTKPANIPYMNLFCDPTQFQCNSPMTLSYVTGLRQFTEVYHLNEKGANFDGPLFALPAGEVKGAIGANLSSYNFNFQVFDNTSASTLLLPLLVDGLGKQVWATYTQVNIPVFGDDLNFPLMRKFDFEASWRHDQYSDLGSGTSNPKMAFNWVVSQDIGLTLRGSWGTSFRAPEFSEQSGLVKNAIAGWNSQLFPQAANILVNCGADPQSGAGRLINPGPGLTGWTGVYGNGASGAPAACGANAQPVGVSLLGAGGTAINAGFRDYVNTQGKLLHPETSQNYSFGAEFAPSAFLKGLDVQATWYSVKINGVLQGFANPNTGSFNQAGLGFSYIVPTDIAIAGVDVAGCSNNNTPTTCPEFESMVQKLLADPRNPVNKAITTSVLWINDGGTFNAGYTKLTGIDFNASYDFDTGDLGAWNVGITGTYYLHRYTANNTSDALNPAAAVPTDDFHTTLGTLGGVAQNGVTGTPQMRYRARLGWSSGPWSVTGFMDYVSHFYHTQNAPPNVNYQCLVTGGTVGGGSLPCAILGYTNLEPSYYTFDLSVGYNTGDAPANEYLKNLQIQLVAQNIMDRHPAFEYRIGTGGGNPAAFDILKSDQGRTLTLIFTKQW
jgi:outer membrane receptor protein involved in Fe transport